MQICAHIIHGHRFAMLLTRETTCTLMFYHIFSVCGLNCHKKCEKKVPNLCGINQKLLAEALDSVKSSKNSQSTPKSLKSENSKSDVSI